MKGWTRGANRPPFLRTAGALTVGSCGQDGREIPALEAGAAHQCAINVRAGQQIRRILRIHTSSVLDAHAVRRGGPKQPTHGAADHATYPVRLVGSAYLARPNRPDRFVGDHQAGDLLGGKAGESALDLPRDDGVRITGLPLCKSLAAANNGS